MTRNTKPVIVFPCRTCGEAYLAEDVDDQDCLDEAQRNAEACCPPERTERELCLRCECLVTEAGRCGCGELFTVEL